MASQPSSTGSRSASCPPVWISRSNTSRPSSTYGQRCCAEVLGLPGRSDGGGHRDLGHRGPGDQRGREDEEGQQTAVCSKSRGVNSKPRLRAFRLSAPTVTAIPVPNTPNSTGNSHQAKERRPRTIQNTSRTKTSNPATTGGTIGANRPVPVPPETPQTASRPAPTANPRILSHHGPCSAANEKTDSATTTKNVTNQVRPTGVEEIRLLGTSRSDPARSGPDSRARTAATPHITSAAPRPR